MSSHRRPARRSGSGAPNPENGTQNAPVAQPKPEMAQNGAPLGTELADPPEPELDSGGSGPTREPANAASCVRALMGCRPDAVRASNCRGSIARRDELDQVIDELVGGWRTEAGCGIPARSGSEARHSKGRIVPANHVKERCGVMALSLTNVVDRFVDKAQVISRLLVGNRQNGRPL
jgi:hypothetical protein